MPFAVLLTADAARDLEDLYQYIAVHDAPGKADHVLTNIENVFGIGGHDAASCPPIPGVYPKELLALGIRDYREIFFKPYRVIYRVAGDVLHVLLITDGRRDMQTLLQRRILSAD